MFLLGSLPVRGQTPDAAAAHIQAYYQELMPTIKQAGRLTVQERYKRFTPAITDAFDLATMTRLAVGPAWKSFSAHSRQPSGKPSHISSWRITRAR